MIEKEFLIKSLEKRINILTSNIEKGYCKKKTDRQKHLIQIKELEYIKSAIELERFIE